MKPAAVFYVLGTLLFFVFAFLQFNDATQYGNHDAWIWIVLYLIGALFNLAALFNKLSIVPVYIWFGFTAGSLLFRMQDDQGNLHLDWINPSKYWDDSGNQMIQQTNESGGLVILLIWALIQIILLKRQQSKQTPAS
uniref:transmembrane 220 family protein n=1 Tax=Ningiella ruwaisensis TaxID=2364274 RepID=UPI0010A019B3|nr:transmembrane 220 family protein [Ningiella ruwaisensis]